MDLVRPKESHFAYGDLHELINKMVLLVSPQSKAKSIEISVAFDETIGPVWMDSEKMKQVILNLLSNALEFTPKGGRIEIETKKHSREDKSDVICIEVRDNGIGIPPSDLNRVFDPYFTTKHKSSMHSGTGLGLFIAHQHMQDHGGTIEVRSSVNKGATFILTLPADHPFAVWPGGQSKKPMQIESINIFRITLPFQGNFAISRLEGRSSTRIVVEVTADQGRVKGYGEGVPIEFVTGETAETVTKDVAAFVSGGFFPHHLTDVSQIWDFVDRLPSGKEHNAALCAIEMALLDALGKEQKRSVLAYLPQHFSRPMHSLRSVHHAGGQGQD